MPELPGGRGARALATAVIVYFLGSIAATGLVDALAPLPEPRLLGLEKLEDEARRAEARLLDGSWADRVEHDLRVRSRVREVLGQPYTLALFWLLREYSGSVIGGTDGSLFLVAHTLPPEGRTDEELAGAAVSVLTALDRRLFDLGTRTVVVPVPRKAVVYRDRMPRRVDPRAAIDEGIVLGLRERGVPVVDLFAVWEGVAPSELYFPWGTHWTQRAELLAAEETARLAGILVPEPERATEILSLGPGRLHTTMFRLLGVDPAMVEAYLQVEGAERFEVFRGRVPAPYSQPQTVGRIALVGTSFSARRQFPWFLSHFTQEAVFNAAEPASNTVDMLLALTREHPGSLPEVLVIEIPAHLAFRRPPFREAGQVLAENPPAAVTVLRALRPEAPFGRAPVPVTEALADLAVVEDGSLLHSADGVVAFRLRGAVRDGAVQVEARDRSWDNGVVATWQAGVPELVLPLVGVRPDAFGYRVRVRAASGEPSLAIDGVELVVPVVPEPLLQGTFGEGRRASGGAAAGWFQELACDGLVVPEHALLLVRLDAAQRPGGPLRVEVRVDGSGALAVEADGLAAGAAVVLGLDGLAGRRLDRVHIEGRGPGGRATEAAVYAPPAKR